MTENEFTEWMAFYTLEPFGTLSDDLLHANICSIIANVNRDPKKGKSFSPFDFTLFQKQEKAPKKLQSPDEVLAMFKANFKVVEKAKA